MIRILSGGMRRGMGTGEYSEEECERRVLKIVENNTRRC